MAGYNISEQVKPGKENAYIEAFYTTKGKDLYCIVPAYRQYIKLRNFKAPSGATAGILGNSKSLGIKQTGNDCVIDLSSMKPGDMPSELFVVKIKNGL